MCIYMPVSEVVKLPINWIRGDDERLNTVFKSLKKGDGFRKPIELLSCGCGKSYMLADGGHRITAAHKLYKKTGKDILVRIHKYVADFE